MDQDTFEALLEHRKIIRNKTFLNKIYRDFYQILLDTHLPKGMVVEIGSGAGFIKDMMPNVVTSDVISGPDIDKVFFAHEMPFKDNSVSAFFMIDVLHHIKDSELAFHEMLRCLKVGGKIIMIEPYNSWWGGIIFKYLHPEKKGYKPKAGWKISGKGRMSDSNPALPWIIFARDRKLFEKKFPKLRINIVAPHTPIRYLLSGGLSPIQLWPASLYHVIKFIEQKISPFNKIVGMFVTIELEKTP